MKPSEIRRELLEQHATIRTMTEVAQTIAKRLRAGVPPEGDLQDCVARLAEAMRAHNAREEELLRELVQDFDAWGKDRITMMDREHMQAHRRLDEAIRGIPEVRTAVAAVGVIALAHLIREHMDREEAAFLNEDVLCDEVVVRDQTDG
jgi:predicted metal-dependent phosphoesterase TrpH